MCVMEGATATTVQTNASATPRRESMIHTVCGNAAAPKKCLQEGSSVFVFFSKHAQIRNFA